MKERAEEQSPFSVCRRLYRAQITARRRSLGLTPALALCRPPSDGPLSLYPVSSTRQNADVKVIEILFAGTDRGCLKSTF